MTDPAVQPPPVAATPATSATTASADDLLSKMAGDEIHRLLAEAQIEPETPALASDPPAGKPADDATVAAAKVPPTPAVGAPDDAAPPPPAASSTAVAADRPAEAENNEPMSADGVSDLLGSLSAPAITSPAIDSAADDAAAAAAAGPGAPAADALSSEPTQVTEPKPADPAGEIGYPWAARLLDWATFPLDPFPDAARHVIGKIAIVTSINAVAVLIYVLVFR